MSAYTESVDSGLEGMNAVSTGVCPGCRECAGVHAYPIVDLCASPECDKYKDEEDRGCYHPDKHTTFAYGFARFDEAWASGEVFDEGSFSSCGCGICGSNLGGTFYDWHWIDEDGVVRHEGDACTDCVMYLANGDEPETWQSRGGECIIVDCNSDSEPGGDWLRCNQCDEEERINR